MSGHTYSPDEETMLATADAVGLRGTSPFRATRSLVEVPGATGASIASMAPASRSPPCPGSGSGTAWPALLGLDAAGSGFVVRFVLGSFNLLVAAMPGRVALCRWPAGWAPGGGAGVLAGLLAFATFLWPHEPHLLRRAADRRCCCSAPLRAGRVGRRFAGRAAGRADAGRQNPVCGGAAGAGPAVLLAGAAGRLARGRPAAAGGGSAGLRGGVLGACCRSCSTTR